MTIELIPPTDPTHRELWLMGFDKEQRDRIIRISIVLFRDPVDLGRFICRANQTPAERLKEFMGEVAKVLDNPTQT